MNRGMTDNLPAICEYARVVQYEHITTSLVNFKNFSRTEKFEIRYPLVYCAVMAREWMGAQNRKGIYL